MKGCEVTEADMLEVMDRSGGICELCRTFVPEGLRHVDHIIPLDKGGPHCPDNLRLLCYRCNCRKGAKMPDQVEPETWVGKPTPGQPFLLNPNWK
jgi:5-methylcytosine-specific restriction endonuclease McrA